MHLTTVQAFDFVQHQQQMYFSVLDQGSIGAFHHCTIVLSSICFFHGILTFSPKQIELYPSLKTYKKRRPLQTHPCDPKIPYRYETPQGCLILHQSETPFKTLIDNLIESLSLEPDEPNLLQSKLQTLLPQDILSHWSFESIWSTFWQHRSGLGDLALWMNDPHITEILINGTESIYCEKQGKLERQPTLISELRLERLMTKLLQHSGRTVNTKHPLVDFALETGERVHIALPPISKQGPLISIRKFKNDLHTLENLAPQLQLSQEGTDYLQQCVIKRKNLVVSGGTGVGKTTLLNCLLSACDPSERLIIAEDTQELCPKHPQVLHLETRTSPHESTATITLSDLIRHALRMRPTRIICGECRGSEAFQMLLAMNSGHPGSMTTVHANSVLESLYRLEIFLLMAGMDISHRAIRQWIASSIDVIIHMQWVNQTQRRITHIVEVKFNSETQNYVLKPIFTKGGLDESRTSWID